MKNLEINRMGGHYIHTKEPRAQEERFQSFCGVPLVRYGKIIGVLVVQRAEAKALEAENEAFLVTLSSQLALLRKASRYCLVIALT